MDDDDSTIFGGPGWDKQSERGKQLLKEDAWWMINFFMPAVQAMNHGWDGTFKRIHDSYIEIINRGKSDAVH